jgi:hypothetical protein
MLFKIKACKEFSAITAYNKLLKTIYLAVVSRINERVDP